LVYIRRFQEIKVSRSQDEHSTQFASAELPHSRRAGSSSKLWLAGAVLILLAVVVLTLA